MQHSNSRLLAPRLLEPSAGPTARAGTSRGRARERARVLASAALIAGLAGGVGPADAVAAPRFEFSGFATLGYARMDVDGAEYRTGAAQDGAGTDGSFAPDTRLGLQGDVELTPRASAGLQLLAREGPDGDVELGVERGFVRFGLGGGATVRAGRLALPVFARSEYRYVGYSNTLVRPVEEVYALLPFGRYDGADLIVQRELGESLIELQLAVGEGRERLYDGLVIDADLARAAIVSLERGPVRLRASWLAADVRMEVPGLEGLNAVLDALPSEVPGRDATRRSLSRERQLATFMTLGTVLDLYPVTLEAEYAVRDSGRTFAAVPSARSWYVSLAYNRGAFTPYGFIGHFDEKRAMLDVRLPVGSPELEAFGAALDASFPELDQRVAGIGLRWDAAAGLAVKLQAERIRRDELGVGFSRGPTFSTDPGDDVTLVSATLDVVF